MVAVLYGASLLLRVDAVQQRAADCVTTIIQKAGDLPISIGSIQVQHLNKIVIKNSYITDEAGDTALSIPKITAHLSPLHMLKGDIRVNTLIIGNPAVKLYREKVDSPLNIQFFLDKLSSNKGSKSNDLPDIRINQIQIYEGSFAYDVREKERKPLFDPAHIAVQDIFCNLSLKKLNSDTLSLYVRSISGREEKGLTLTRLSARIEATPQCARIGNLCIQLPASTIEAEELTVAAEGDSKIAINGELTARELVPSDFASLLPTLSAPNLPLVSFNAQIGGSKGSTSSKVALSTSDKSFDLQVKAEIKNLLQPQEATLSITESVVREEAIKHLQTIIGDSTGNLDVLKRLGNINISGNATHNKRHTQGEISIKSDCGNIHGNTTITSSNSYTTLQLQQLQLGKLLKNSALGPCDIEAQIDGVVFEKEPNIDFSTTIKEFNYNEYTYQPITLKGSYIDNGLHATISSSDPNASGHLTCSMTKKEDRKDIKFELAIDTLIPDSLNVGSGNSGIISATANGTYNGYNTGKSLLDIRIYNIAQSIGKKKSNIRMVQFVDNNLLDNRSLIINSDFLDAKVAGQFSYSSLAGTFKKIIHTHAPALSSTKAPNHANNAYIFSLNIRNTSTISRLLGLPVTINSNSNITGQCDDSRKLFIATATLNNANIKKYKFSTIEANIYSNDSTAGLRSVLKALPTAKKASTGTEQNNNITINVNAEASNNHIATGIDWEGSTTQHKGTLGLDVALKKIADKTEINATLAPNEIIYEDTKWDIAGCNIKGTTEEVEIDNFYIESDNKSLNITGKLGKESEDRLNVLLNNIELESILKIVDFRAVTFGGKTNGKVTLDRAFNHPQFNCNIEVDSFTFEKGYLGALAFKAAWDEENKSVTMRGDIDDVNNAHTVVEGFVSPANDTLSLRIDADRTRLAFLNSMLEGIISDVDATATGKILLSGPLGGLNLTGCASASGPMRIVATNATYTILNDSVRMLPNKMIFENVKIADPFNNSGYINGSVNHKELGQWTCDLDITANNLLAYHSDDFYTQPFYGTAFVTGDANITANNKGLFIHADVTGNKNTLFVYDASEVASVSSNNFVKFTDKNKRTHTHLQDIDDEELKSNHKSYLSRLNLEFMIDVTPDVLLKVITNRRTGDYIDLYGSGPISAVFDEKEGFSMNGRLDLDRGTYRFTMQDIFIKEFDITKGSTLGFNGDPFDAELNLRTKYLVPSASLSDLDPSGKRHKSVKANCLMNITGKLEAPQLDFDIELPDANEEERELLASAINTPEQKNTQFVYLLGIGKFYTYDYNRGEGNAQSSSAMESLISNTISGQLNNLLSQIIDNRNWNFSGNFSSSERGWNSMEVEGILEGRLLDNRLLINGNFGYRDNPLANSNFIGDFEVQWLLDRNGKVSLKAYNKTNDRYFSESNLNTQGAGIILRHDFNDWRWWIKNNEKKTKKEENK